MAIYRFTFHRQTPRTVAEHALKEAIEDSKQVYQLGFLETIVINLQVFADQEEPSPTNETGKALVKEISSRYDALGHLVSWQKDDAGSE